MVRSFLQVDKNWTALPCVKMKLLRVKMVTGLPWSSFIQSHTLQLTLSSFFHMNHLMEMEGAALALNSVQQA